MYLQTMNNLYPNNQYQPSPLVKLGAIALGIYVLDNLFNNHDTLNYTLWHKKKLVYHGIAMQTGLKQDWMNMN